MTTTPGRKPGGSDGSPSSLSLYSECPRAYRLRYIDRIRRPATVPMRLGSLIHGVLDRVATERIDEATATWSVASLERPIEPFELYAPPQSDPALATEAEEMLKEVAPRVDLSRTFATEQRVSYTGESWSVEGFADRIDLWTDQEYDSKRAELVDYKTGRFVPTPDELRWGFQALIYIAATKQRYPDHYVSIRFWYLRPGITMSIPWSRQLDDRAYSMVDRTISRIRSDTEWLPTVSTACARCLYRDDCEAFLDLRRTEPVDIPDTDLVGVPVEELIGERKRLAAVVKVAEVRRKAIDAILRECARADGSVSTPAGRATMVTRRDIRFRDDRKALTVALDAGIPVDQLYGDVVRLRSSTLRKLVEDSCDPEALRRLEALQEDSATTYLRVS